MRSFRLYYRYKADFNKVHSERCIEMLLEKFGCKIVDKKKFSCPVNEIIKADENLEQCDYQVTEGYLYFVEFEMGKVPDEDIEVLMLLLSRAFGPLVTFDDDRF